MRIHRTHITADIELEHVGPPLAEGPLPAVFYFALHAQESLGLDSYNQPVAFLSHYPMRIFSLSLPGHDLGVPQNQALRSWATSLAHGDNVIEKFLDRALAALAFLERHEALLPGKVASAGLSRGAFIATHLAARTEMISDVLGFAPLTALSYTEAFKNVPIVPSLDLEHIIPHLIGKKIRYHIGNHDTLVGTERCFHFIHALSQASYAHKIRSPQVELILYPSIGHKGHGTPKEIFHQGALWLTTKLL
jgi:hypothetical protein